MTARCGLLLALLGLGACGDQVVHIRLESGADPGCQDSELPVMQTWIVKAQLHIGSPPTGPTWNACVETAESVWRLKDLEGKFRYERKVFDNVPSEAPWRLVIAGYPRETADHPDYPNGEDTCDRPRTQAAVLCGMTTGSAFPPGNQLTIPIDCMPRLPGDYTKKIKDLLKSCASNLE